MKKFGIFINPNYKDINHVFELLRRLHTNSELSFYMLPEQSEYAPKYIDILEKEQYNSVECILTFGGDGTFLRAVKFSLMTDAPLLGINLGKLGFLSESSLEELEKSIDDLKKNKFKIQHRILMKIDVKRDNKIIFSSLALNDAVIHRGDAPRLIDIKVSSNHRFVLETRCDGFIAATPTGSTAYSLSAGGPIISPVMEAIVLTPLNPHVLTVRPLVFSAQDTIRFQLLTPNHKSILQLDGKNSKELEYNDEVIVNSASRKIKFIKLTNKTFYQILRKKLNLGRI